MANVELVRLPDGASSERMIRVINSLIDVFLGNDGGRVLMVGHDGTSTDPNLGTNTGTGLYQTVVRSSGTNHLQVRKSDDSANRLTVTDTATTADALVVATTSTFNGLTTHNAGATFTAGQTVTGNGTVQFKTPLSAACSALFSLTTTPTDVTGASLSLAPGIWHVVGIFDFDTNGAGDVGFIGLGSLATTGGAATIALPTSLAVFQLTSATARATVAQSWLVTVTATTTVSLQGAKSGGAGASRLFNVHTTITATNA